MIDESWQLLERDPKPTPWRTGLTALALVGVCAAVGLGVADLLSGGAADHVAAQRALEPSGEVAVLEPAAPGASAVQTSGR